MRLWLTSAATTVVVVALCFFNLLVNQNYMYLLSNGIYITTYPGETYPKMDGRITAQTAFYPLNVILSNSTLNSTVDGTSNSTLNSTVDGTSNSTLDFTVDGTSNSTLNSTLDGIVCCSGYVLWNGSCYWPGVDYELALERWNNATVVEHNSANETCPSFVAQVNVPPENVFVVFWILTAILICVIASVVGVTKAFAVATSLSQQEFHCICGYFWIVSMLCYLTMYVVIGIVPVAIPIEYVDISQGNPWPVNILTYVLTCVFVMSQAVVIVRNYDKIREKESMKTAKAKAQHSRNSPIDIEMGIIE